MTSERSVTAGVVLSSSELEHAPFDMHGAEHVQHTEVDVPQTSRHEIWLGAVTVVGICIGDALLFVDVYTYTNSNSRLTAVTPCHQRTA